MVRVGEPAGHPGRDLTGPERPSCRFSRKEVIPMARAARRREFWESGVSI